MPIRKILVPTDLSEESKRSLRHALELARAGGGELILVPVTDFSVYPCALDGGLVVLPFQERELRARRGNELEVRRARPVPAALGSRSPVREGRPVRETVQPALEHAIGS